MNISEINPLSQLTNTNQVNQTNQNQVSGASFQDLLKQSITEVNKTQAQGYNAMEGIATGNIPNLQEAVQKIEEAELSLKLALEVKNKAVMGFKEVMKMQV
jgi:flagellar hook-basal body complex protein FliE